MYFSSALLLQREDGYLHCGVLLSTLFDREKNAIGFEFLLNLLANGKKN